MQRPPVRIAMASYGKVTTMCGEKRSLRQVDLALGAMFSNVGLHPVSLTQTMGPTLGGLTGESTSVIPLSPSQGASLQHQVMGHREVFPHASAQPQCLSGVEGNHRGSDANVWSNV